ncbi:MAG: hypothetical protein ACFFAJ_16445 [Candidatus Hodarchaeota archaeon]
MFGGFDTHLVLGARYGIETIQGSKMKLVPGSLRLKKENKKD